jgi:hypothetical protein
MVDLDEQARLREIERADRAKALLDNPILKEAFEAIEAETLHLLEQTHDEIAERKLNLMFRLNRKYQNILKGYIETGKLAAFQLEQKRKFKLFGVN